MVVVVGVGSMVYRYISICHFIGFSVHTCILVFSDGYTDTDRSDFFTWTFLLYV